MGRRYTSLKGAALSWRESLLVGRCILSLLYTDAPGVGLVRWTARKRFSWRGERSQCLRQELRSIVRPWQSSSQVDLLTQLRRCGSRRSIRESCNCWTARMERTTALLGGVLPLQLVPLEHMTVGWTGVTPLKPKPPLVHHQCYPRLHKNSLRSGLLGPKQMTRLSSEGGQMPRGRRWRELN